MSLKKMVFLKIVFFSSLSLSANLEGVIKIAAQKYKVSPQNLTAIAHIETLNGKYTKVRHNKNGSYDMGPFQINSVHWTSTCKDYDLSTDLGNALCAAKLLAQAKKHKNTDPYWIGRYHSKTPTKKLQYYKKVVKYLNNQK